MKKGSHQATDDGIHPTLLKRFHEELRQDEEPLLICRAPGRVNLIGEHIDYQGYAVLPMAVEQDIQIAVGRRSDTSAATIRIINTDSSHFPAREVSVEPSEVISGQHDWVNYARCALRGIYDTFQTKQQPPPSDLLQGLTFIVQGSVPSSAGLSSSSAIVVVFALAFSSLLHLSLSMHELADICTDCERHIGTIGGGMDQSASCLAEEGQALYMEFNPLRTTPVTLPPGAVFVIANSLIKADKAVSAATHYNKRVLECRCGCLLLAKALQVSEWEEVYTLKQLEEALLKSKEKEVEEEKEDGLVAMIRSHLVEEGYTLKQMMHALFDLGNDEGGGSTASNSSQQQPTEDISLRRRFIQHFFADKQQAAELVFSASPRISEQQGRQENEKAVVKQQPLFCLQQRLLHVYQESRRVESFKEICDNLVAVRDQKGDQHGKVGGFPADDATETALQQLGQLMRASHDSCRDLYDCSCPALDTLVQICQNSPGAYGSRLTGAGWGGCCVSLVKETQVEQFLEVVQREYYDGYYQQHCCKGDEKVGSTKAEKKEEKEYLFVTKPASGAHILFTSSSFEGK